MRALSRPVICAVTDRRRLRDPSDDGLVRFVQQAAASGVTLIELRERDLDDRRLFAVACRVVSAVAGTGAAVVVNERADVALASGAQGVHLRGDSFEADRLRSVMPPGFLIGRSVHGVDEAIRAEATGIDYLILGTIYSTRSKSHAVPAGVGLVSDVAGQVSVPVLAIGGITAERAGELAAAGAAGIAAIGLFAEAFGAPQDGAPALRETVNHIRAAFDRGAAR